MGKAGTIFGVLTALLAITAAVFSFILFNRRNEFRGRADKLAATVADMVKKLDVESSSDVQSKVNFTPADPVALTPEEGTLGWKTYHEARNEMGEYPEVGKTLDLAKKLAFDINERRNALAETIVKAAKDLRIPDTELEETDLKHLLADKERFNNATSNVLQLTRAITARDDRMIQTFAQCGNIIGHQFQLDMCWQREEMVDEDGNTMLGEYKVGVPLTEFTNRVTALNTRCNDYAQTIVDGINRVAKHNWETNTDQLTDEKEYAGALTSLLNDFDDINESLALFEKAKIEIAEYKVKMEEMVDELEQTREELNKAQDTIVEQAIKIKNLMATGFIPDEEGGDGQVAINPNLEGKVVEVNNDWNFIILDLGRNKVREQMEMLVAREDNLIGKVQISKVLREISIAELLPEIMDQTGEKVKVGDRVILPYPKTEPTTPGR